MSTTEVLDVPTKAFPGMAAFSHFVRVHHIHDAPIRCLGYTSSKISRKRSTSHITFIASAFGLGALEMRSALALAGLQRHMVEKPIWGGKT